MKCVACGTEALVEGTLTDGTGTGVFFNPGDLPLLKRAFGIGYRAVRAYACIHCQHLQLAVDFEETDRERYQQFEGEQPDVLERINSEAKGQSD
jgi:hypothetical protein